ncbi:protein CutA homolog [Sipha flava]|uniref:Protein CutA n=1 Tax=Sipha flava TaxID=143950 RepID=A0A2S2QWA9_9HEMI|nr:protein CutA homolog [Sipha flava]
MYKSGLHSIVHVTAPTIELAKTLAQGIVKHNLAACVNLIPNITSIYKWKDEVNEDSEILMIIKTRTSRVDDLTNYVKSNHPYEVCEVISTKIDNGNIPYLNWISESVPEEISQDSST